ncbi:hypothetical protein F5051DRAFT_421212 [Lentinula edodes]|nr:hypothetical protein F5051DRAFT_421212 [Lentinula edodes]
MDRDVVIPQPIELPRLLVFGDGMEMDVDGDAGDGDAGDGDGNIDDDVGAALDADVDGDMDVDEDSDSESTTSTTSRISDISSVTSVSSSSSSSSIIKSPAPVVVYVPPPMRMYNLSSSFIESTPHSKFAPDSDPEFESSIPSHRLPPSSHSHSRSRSHSQHPRRHLGLGLDLARVSVDKPNVDKSQSSVCRYKYQGGETGVMTGGVMLGSTTRSPFTPTTRPTRASTRSRPPLARPTKRGTARTLILGPDSSSLDSSSSSSLNSSSLDWRRRRPRVPSVPVA